MFSCKNDILSKSVYVLLVFLLLRLVATVESGTETLANSLKVIRLTFLLLAFFLFRFANIEQIKKFIKTAFVITMIQSVLYFLQFMGIHLLAGATEAETIEDLGVEFSMNTPTLTLLFLFLTLKADFLKGKRSWLMILFFSMLFLTFVRGLIISVIIGLIYYVLRQDDKKQKMQILLAIILVLPIVFFVIGKKSAGTESGSTSGDITYVYNNINDLSNMDQSNGSFTLRIAMLAERAYYIIENPQYLLFGVGTMHEKSPRTVSQFDFHIGTVNSELPLGRTIIETPDITWSPIVLRYGLVGILIYLWMMIVVLVVTWKLHDSLMILGPLFLVFLFSSFGGNFFNNPERLFLLSLVYAMLSRAHIEKRYFYI